MTEKDQEEIVVEPSTGDQGSVAEAEVEGQAEPAVIEGEVVEEVTDQEAVPEGEETEEDVIALLREQLEEVQEKAEEYLDGWQRARAEFINYRRREDVRRKQMDQEARSRVLGRLLPVLDDLERAYAAIPEQAHDDSWVEGLFLVGHKFESALEQEGLSLMETQPGDRFDPTYHEAVLSEPSEEFGEGRIIQVLQKGYKLNGEVLRPALVRVSSGRAQNTEEDEQ